MRGDFNARVKNDLFNSDSGLREPDLIDRWVAELTVMRKDMLSQLEYFGRVNDPNHGEQWRHKVQNMVRRCETRLEEAEMIRTSLLRRWIDAVEVHRNELADDAEDVDLALYAAFGVRPWDE